MDVAELTKTRNCIVVRSNQITVASRLIKTIDIVADVGNALDVVQEASVWSWHVSSHLIVEAITSLMIDLQYRIEELEEGALAIASTSILSPRSFAIAFVIEDSVWQAGCLHVHATSQERSDVVVEDLWMASVVHAFEKFADIDHALLEVCQTFHDCCIVLTLHCLHSSEHRVDQWTSTRLHRVGDDQEPRFIVRTSGCMKCNQVAWFC